MAKFSTTNLTFADLVYSLCDYLLDSEEEDFIENHGDEAWEDVNHIWSHAKELHSRLYTTLREYETTDWTADLEVK